MRWLRYLRHPGWARVEMAAHALDDAATQFEFYARQHDAKGTLDGVEKAEVNRQFAIRMRAALERLLA